MYLVKQPNCSLLALMSLMMSYFPINTHNQANDIGAIWQQCFLHTPHIHSHTWNASPAKSPTMWLQ